MTDAKPKLFLWGAGGHAKVVADIVRLENRFDLIGFLNDVEGASDRQVFCDAITRTGEDGLRWFIDQGAFHVIVAIGRCNLRLEKAAKAATLTLQFANAIHPSAVVAADCKMGVGNVIVAGAVINPGCGNHVIVNTSSSVGHDCTIHDGVHIGPGSRIAGDSTIGSSTWVGVGTSVREKTQIGKNCCIGIFRDI